MVNLKWLVVSAEICNFALSFQLRICGMGRSRASPLGKQTKLISPLIYPDSFEHKTGFNAVRTRISELCTSSVGRNEVEDMAFMTDFTAISRALGSVDEMTRAISPEGGFSLGAVPELALSSE